MYKGFNAKLVRVIEWVLSVFWIWIGLIGVLIFFAAFGYIFFQSNEIKVQNVFMIVSPLCFFIYMFWRSFLPADPSEQTSRSLHIIPNWRQPITQLICGIWFLLWGYWLPSPLIVLFIPFAWMIMWITWGSVFQQLSENMILQGAKVFEGRVISIDKVGKFRNVLSGYLSDMSTSDEAVSFWYPYKLTVEVTGYQLITNTLYLPLPPLFGVGSPVRVHSNNLAYNKCVVDIYHTTTTASLPL